jgi:hypothetical protein
MKKVLQKENELDPAPFAYEECMSFSIQAGLQTRNPKYPIYCKPQVNETTLSPKQHEAQKARLKQSIKDFLESYEKMIISDGMKEDVHLKKISELPDKLTQNYSIILHEGFFRIGIAQKIINLFLKYMWSLGRIPEPCHCPIDGIVKSKILKENPAVKLADWTALNSIDEYKSYINIIKELSSKNGISVARWEYENWQRR